MNINWKVRIKNKAFWVAIIPAVLMLVQAVAAVFGLALELGEIGDKLLTIVEAAFLVLGIVGIVNDPTTAGLADSARAMNYTEPN
jgi:phi LC3 family holin